MSTGAIIVLAIIAAVALIVLFALMPRLKAKKEERRLEARRREVAGRHRAEAEDREQHAMRAEREAEQARREAELHHGEARMHEEGLADDRLREHDDDRETGRFTRDGDRDVEAEQAERDRQLR